MQDYKSVRTGSVGQRLKFLSKDFLLYGGFLAASKFISIFTTPILTRYFATSEYGVIDLLAVFNSFVTLIIVLGQDSAVVRYFYETEDQEERKQIVSQALVIIIILCAIICIALIAGVDFILNRILAAPEYIAEYYVVVLSLPFVVLASFTMCLLKWVFARTKFIIISLGSTLSTIGLTLILIFIFKTGFIGVFYAQLLSMGFFALLGLIFCRPYIIFPKGFHYALPLMAYGWPYMLIGLTRAAIPAVDRVNITHYLGLEAMGLYAVGFRLASLLNLPITAFQTAWGPFAFALYKEPDAMETYNKVFLYFVVLMSLLTFCLSALAEPIIVLFASARYSIGSVVVLPLAFGILVEGIAWICGIGIDLSKKTYLSTISYFIGLVISLFAIIILICPFGIAGVAYGVLIGRLAQALSYSAFAYWAYPLRFNFRNPAIVFMISIGLAIIIQYVNLQSFFEQLVGTTILFLVFIGFIWQFIIPICDRVSLIDKFRNIITAKGNHSK